MKRIRILNNIKEFLIVSIIFFVLTTIATFPLIFFFFTHFIDKEDSLNYCWYLWWVKHSIFDLKRSPFITNYQFFPFNIDISYEISYLHSLLVIGITYLYNTVVSYNFLIFFTFITTGLGMYYFMKLITKNDFRASILGAIIFTFSYYRIARGLGGHLDLASTDWYGFYLFFLFKFLLDNKRLISTIFFSVFFLALMAYTDLRNYFFLISFTGALAISTLIYFVLIKKSFCIKKITKSLILFFTFHLVLILPLVYLNRGNLANKIYNSYFDSESNAHFLSLFLLPNDTILAKIIHFNFPRPYRERITIYLGIIQIILTIIFFLFRKGKKIKSYKFILGITTTFFFLISLGSLLPIHRFLYERIFIFKVLRIPSRFVILIEIGISIFAALGMQFILNLTKNPRLKNLLLFFLIFFIFIDNLTIPISLVKSPLAPFIYSKLSKENSSFSILEIPLAFRFIQHGWGALDNSRSYFAQTIHQKPMIGGYLSTLDKSIYQYFQNDPLINKIILCQEDAICQNLSDEDKLNLINFYKIKYITVYSGYKNNEAMKDFLKKNLKLKLVENNQSYVVFKVI